MQKQAPTKKPSSPGSIDPQGPKNPAMTLYANQGTMSGKVPVHAPKPGPQPIGQPQTVGQKSVKTLGAVPVKNTPVAPGNQGTKNAHTKPEAIKPVMSNDKMAKKIDHVVSTSALEKIGGDKLGDKKGKSNAARTLYPKQGMKKSVN